MTANWYTLAEKKPKKERRYAITKDGVLGNKISSASWYRGHFYRRGHVVDDKVIAWSDLEPYREKRCNKDWCEL